jgi:hypothetical protein
MSEDARETTAGVSLREHAYALLFAAMAADKAGADVVVTTDEVRRVASVLLVAAALVNGDELWRPQP